MSKDSQKSGLSRSRQRLVELMQEINFGRIEEIEVRDGEPVFDPFPQVIRVIKFCGENGPRQKAMPHLMFLIRLQMKKSEKYPTGGAKMQPLRLMPPVGLLTIGLA